MFFFNINVDYVIFLWYYGNKVGFMNRKKIISIFLSLVLVFSIFLFKSKDSFSLEEIDYIEFQNDVAEACKDDDFECIYIDENFTFDETINVLNIDSNNENSQGIYVEKSLYDCDKEQFFKVLGYSVKKDGESYKLYTKFQLKRLIVQGKLDEFYGAKNVISGYKDFNILCFETESETERAYKLLKQNEDISVMIDSIVSSNGYADNTYDYSDDKSWGAKAIDYAGYYDYLTENKMTDKEVVVAVIDTGINTSHEMFKNRFLYDNNDNVLGYSYYLTTYNYSGYQFEDDNGHGTHVSGIICDVTPENVKILPIKALDKNGDGSLTNILAAVSLVESISNNYFISCVNMSLGGDTYDEEAHNAFNELFDSLKNKGILTAVAAGNEAMNVADSTISSCESAVVVSALKRGVSFSYEFDDLYSNYGAVDISAPGTGINSAFKNSINGENEDIYIQETGTSMATPFVSGVISLIYLEKVDGLSKNDLTYEFALDMEEFLKENTIDLGREGYDEYYGCGMVNLKYFDVTKKGDILTFKDKNLDVEIKNDSEYYQFQDSLMVEITCLENDYTIYYTSDGSIPNINSSVYESKLDLSESQNMSFIAYKFDKNGNIISVSNLYNIGFFNSGVSIWSYMGFYTLGSNVYISKYTGHFKELVIPEQVVIPEKGINGTIVGIRNEVFSKNTDLVSITLPSTCTLIRYNAFYNCSNLRYVSIAGVTRIEEYGFYDCEKLETVYAPNLESIGNYAFYMAGFTKIVSNASEGGAFFQKLTSAGEGAFAHCANLSSVELENFKTMYDFCFMGSEKLIECKLPNLKSIGNYCFMNCYSLSDFEIGESVSVIGKANFIATSLKKVQLHTNNKYLYTDGNGLYSVNGLVSFISDKSISYKILDSVVINSKTINVTSIEDFAFDHSSLKRLTIPSGITLIGLNAFYYSNIDIVDYNAKDCLNTKYILNGETYPIFYSTNINTLNINDVNSIPSNLFSSAIIKNININKYDIEYNKTAFYDSKIVNLFFNFNDTFDLDYFRNIIGTRILFCLENIYSKVEFYSNDHFDLGSGDVVEKVIYYVGSKNGYYLYSINQSEKFDIFFAVKDKEVTYDGKYHNIELSINSGVKNYSVVYSLDGENYNITNINTVDAFKNSTDGEMTVYFRISASGYNDTYGLAYLKINKVKLTISIDDASGTYGNIPNLSSVGYSITSGSVISGDKISINFYTDATIASSVGNYEIFGDFDSSVINYEAKFINGVYTVKQKRLVISVDDIECTYGEVNLSNDSYIIDTNIGNLVNNDDLGVTLSYSTTTFDAGIYVINLSYTNSNYKVDYTAGTLTILKRIIVVDVLDAFSYYGDDIVLKGKGDGYVISSGSFVDNDEEICNLSLETTAKITSDVGTYEITCNYNQMKNYTVKVNNGTYSILKRKITFVANNSSSFYGDEISLNSYKIESGNFIGNDLLFANIAVVTSITNRTDFGEYDITFTYNEMSNYEFTFTSGKYEILKRKVNYKIFDSYSIYGDEVLINEFEIESGNFVDNDESLCNFKLSFELNNRTNVGNYEINGQYNDLKNYEITINKGNYKILKREISVKIRNFSSVYGEKVDFNNNSYDIVRGDFIDDDLSMFNLTIETTANSTSTVGNYVISGTFEELDNYDICIINGNLSIKPKNIRIKLLTQSGIYGYAPALDDLAYEVTKGEIIGNDNLNLAFSVDATIDSNVGEYTITATYSNKNYICLISSGTYVVNKRQVTVKLLDQNAPHLGRFEIEQDAYTVESGTIFENDELNIEIESDYNKTSLWGEYNISVKYDNPNYDVLFVNELGESVSIEDNGNGENTVQNSASVVVSFSIYDGLIILAVVIIIIFVIVLICKASSKKKKAKKKKKKKSANSSNKSKANKPQNENNINTENQGGMNSKSKQS